MSNQPTKSKSDEDEKTIAELENAIAKARKGDRSTLPVLWKMVDDPQLLESFGGNLANNAEQSLINAAGGDDLAYRVAITRKLELMRAELCGASPTPIEKLLVERIVACWLQVQDADVRYAQAKQLSLEWGGYFQDRMDRAHRRYLSAIKTLALVRKLALPALQVNIARKQINVGQAAQVNTGPTIDAA